MASRTNRRGLTAKLSVGSTVPMVVIMAIMGAATVLLVRSNAERLVERNARNTLELVSYLMDVEFTGTVRSYLRSKAEGNRDLMELFYRRAQAGELSEAEAKAQYAALMLDPDYGRVGTTGYLAAVTTAGILEIHPLSPGVDASVHAFMQSAMRMRNGYLEYEWQNVGEAVPRLKAGYLAYFEPWDLMVWASSYKSEFLSLVNLSELRERVSQITVDQEGYVFLIDESYGLRAGRDPLRVSFALSSAAAGASGGTGQAAGAGVAAGAGQTAELVMGPREGAYTLHTEVGRVRVELRREPTIGWMMVVVTPLRTYDRMVTVLAALVVATVVFSALFIHLFVRLLVGRNLRPMHAMREVVDSISHGDLTGTVPIVSRDELGDIARLFNRVVEEFGAVLIKMRSVIEVLSEAVQNLSTSTQEIASTSNEQAAAVKEVLSTMEDADRLSKGVEVKVQEVARIAGNTKENVQRGFELIQTSLRKMDEIRTTNAETISGIKTLGDRIESIWDIVNIINGIADQTKIIAFNAELEAAAAGEAGKNFQIVAGEIRRLADGTVDSTNEIKVKINEIQHASDKLIIASEEGTQRIREGWDVSNNIRGVFEDVLSSSEISANSAGEISRSMRMQVASFEQIFLTLKQISESIDSFVESTAYTTEVSEQLKGIADAFKAQVGSYTVRGEN